MSHKKKYLAVIALGLIAVTLALVSYFVSPNPEIDTPIGSNLPTGRPDEQLATDPEVEARVQDAQWGDG